MDRITRTLVFEDVDVDVIVDHVRLWHETYRADDSYAGIRVVAPIGMSGHCTVAIDFTSREAADAYAEPTERWLRAAKTPVKLTPSATLYRRVYTSREDQPGVQQPPLNLS